MIHKADENGWNSREVRDLGFLDLLQYFHRVEVGMEIIGCSPNDERKNPHRAGMAQGSYGQKFIVLGYIINITKQELGAGQDVTVSEHDSLRSARGAGGIPEVRKVVETDFHMGLLL
jgi:hypothetical protein